MKFDLQLDFHTKIILSSQINNLNLKKKRSVVHTSSVLCVTIIANSLLIFQFSITHNDYVIFYFYENNIFNRHVICLLYVERCTVFIKFSILISPPSIKR
jgi:hypothetical protein